MDFDGTLSHLVDDPASAGPADGAADVVGRLAERTRVVVVSGRPVDVLRGFLPADLPVTWAGGHGAEVAEADGPIEPAADLQVVHARRDAAQEALEALLADAPAGWHVELKPTGLAVHSRLVEDPSAHADRVRALLDHHAGDDMEVSTGHDVVELRPAGVDKGVAVSRLLADDHRVPVAIGDDVTDEDTFAVAVAGGGTAILVATTPRRSHATMRVADPDEVVALLAAWLDRD
nr:trehalose-phosphatase [Salsipaludibacter albus]